MWQRWKKFASVFGPGVITGAADDDPSGIATYSITGANFGTRMLWMAWFTWPLMAMVQFMCARIGMVTGRGLSEVFAQRFPRWLVLLFSLALLVANTFNVGADLAAMADAGNLLTGVNTHLLIVLFASVITFLTVSLRYIVIARYLKWLVLALFAYVFNAFYIGPDWLGVFHSAISVSLPHGSEEWATVVAILGTTISPYLFYWETGQEVEEAVCKGNVTLESRIGATESALKDRRLDVGVGTFFSNSVMFFIILTTALTLNKHGVTHLETSEQVAEALKPFAGRFATLLYTLGLLGTGLLAIPTLTGSAAYALSEATGHRGSLDEKFSRVPFFYSVIILSTAIAVLMNFIHLNPVRTLFWSAVVNGVLAPMVLVAVLLVASNSKIMQGQPSSKFSVVAVGFVTLLMTLACVGMFLF